MAPHYSSLSIGAYRKRFDEALAAHRGDDGRAFVESWHTQPEYLDALAANVRATLRAFPAERDDVLTVFTAHSLPESIIAARRAVRPPTARDGGAAGRAAWPA